MKPAYRPLLVISLVVAGTAAVVAFSLLTEPKELIPWRTDLAAARGEASRTGKPVFLYLTASWCGPCQSLRSTTWSDKRVAAALQNYVPVKVDVDAQPDVTARYLRTSANLEGGIPAFRVLDSEGRIKRQAVGALGPEEFVDWLNTK